MDAATVKALWDIVGDKANIAYVLALAIIALGFRWAWTKLGQPSVVSPETIHPEREPTRPVPIPGQTPLCAICNYRNHHEEPWTQEDLRRHRFWRYMDHAMDMVIPRLTLKEYGRQVLAIDFLSMKFRYANLHLRQFVDSADLSIMTPMELEDGLINAIEEAIRDYEAEALRLAMHKHGTQAMEVFVSKFSDVHAPVVTQVREHIIVTCQSHWIGDDNVTKVASILDFMVSVFQRTLADAERTMGRLNGRLSGLQYNGVMIGPCPDSVAGETVFTGGC